MIFQQDNKEGPDLRGPTRMGMTGVSTVVHCWPPAVDVGTTVGVGNQFHRSWRPFMRCVGSSCEANCTVWLTASSEGLPLLLPHMPTVRFQSWPGAVTNTLKNQPIHVTESVAPDRK